MSERNRLSLGALVLLIGLLPVSAGADHYSLRKVAMEGQTLPDGTTLQTIVAACSEQAPFRPCVAISPGGRVAFYGTTGAGLDAIFTQRGVVVESGEDLPDGSTLGIDSSTIVGGLARNIRDLAFPGLEVDTSNASTTRALFTREGLVVKQGETLPDGTTASINFLGGLAINARAGTAFHGSNAVFTQDGTLVQARQELPDGTIAEGISFFGGVASGGPGGRVAFQGFTDNQLVIFTQDGLVAKAGALPDGTELQSIDPLAGVAMSPRGEVVFHGRTDGYDGVFNQRRLLARTGTRLRDGTKLDVIRPEGGIAVDHRGTVVFHGESHGKQAVFSQKGLIARVGDRIRGGGRLEAIRAEGGVAINSRGQVAFHGITDGKAAIFVTGGGRR